MIEEIPRILALDYGHKRIGAAISDPSGQLATPLEPILRTDKKITVTIQLQQLIDTYQVSRVVLGLPMNLDGTEGSSAKAVRTFGETIASKISVPIDFFDERLTTAAAERSLVAMGMRRSKRKELRDSVAATLLLEEYLAARNNSRES